MGELRDTKSPLFSSDPGWLPAIEMTGEGVFLRLSEDRLIRVIFPELAKSLAGRTAYQHIRLRIFWAAVR